LKPLTRSSRSRVGRFQIPFEQSLDQRGAEPLNDQKLLRSRNDGVRRGYKNIRIKFRIKADVPDEQLEELCRLGPTYSPVFDSITRGVNVAVGLER
jgi:hypothetical protein